MAPWPRCRDGPIEAGLTIVITWSPHVSPSLHRDGPIEAHGEAMT